MATKHSAEDPADSYDTADHSAESSATNTAEAEDGAPGEAAAVAEADPATDGPPDSTTVALDLNDLAASTAEAARDDDNASDTRPVPIVATASSHPNGADSANWIAAAPAAEAADIAATAPRPTPTIAPLPSDAFVDDDPNATNQLVPSSGLTGLDVLGALDDSSGSHPAIGARSNPSAGSNPGASEHPGDMADEVDPTWAMADQPTMEFKPQLRVVARPAYLETGEQAAWPPRPTSLGGDTSDTQAAPPAQAITNPRPIPRPATRPVLPGERLSSPTGRRPLGNAEAAYSDPRMRRYVELRMQRGAHAHGQRGPTDNPPVMQMVRQWWNDLMPGMQKALDHQHEARASGVYPLPAHDAESAPAATTRLGDAFGRLAAAVRDLGGRAQSVAMPALTRLHDQAEQAAQAIVTRLEGPQVRQQAPFLGPGRLAVFFRQGVTVGQAQRLLLVHRARPMRLIPRKHGFLAMVVPGREATVGAELRQHPYVRDVVFLEYDDEPRGEAAIAH